MSPRASATPSVVLALLVAAVLAACATSGATDGALDAGPDAALDAPDAEPARGPLCPSNACPPGFADCNGDPADGCEVNIASSADNCGACGVSCTAEAGPGPENTRAVCTKGACTLECKGRDLIFTTDGTWANCGTPISDGCLTRTSCDVDNCGGCGIRCGDGVPCYGGTCGCPVGKTKCGSDTCGGSCFDLQQDPYHCGTCTVACPFEEPWLSLTAAQRQNAAPACKAGACAVACTAGWAHCSANPADGCETRIDTEVDCGACGNTCPAGTTCQGGKCGCAAGEVLCDGVCTNLALDVENCGSCRKSCPGARAGGNGKPTCNDGACGYACDPLFADCNGSTTDGCETNTGANPQHCGSCSVACETDQRCWSGKCAEQPCVFR